MGSIIHPFHPQSPQLPLYQGTTSAAPKRTFKRIGHQPLTTTQTFRHSSITAKLHSLAEIPFRVRTAEANGYSRPNLYFPDLSRIHSFALSPATGINVYNRNRGLSEMKKTARETEEHRHRATLIANQMGKEYGDWFGYPEHSPVGRNLAIGEYIVELCEIEPHDEWLDAAKDAYLKWKEFHRMTMTPPLKVKV